VSAITRSDVYAKQRSDLLEAELELMRHQERVAEMRRALPLDTVVNDYVMSEGDCDLDADDEASIRRGLIDIGESRREFRRRVDGLVCFEHRSLQGTPAHSWMSESEAY